MEDMELEDELTEKMHSEFQISKETDDKLRAGCVWLFDCDRNSTKEEIEKSAKSYSISYEIAMKWQDYWVQIHEEKMQRLKKQQ